MELMAKESWNEYSLWLPNLILHKLDLTEDPLRGKIIFFTLYG